MKTIQPLLIIFFYRIRTRFFSSTIIFSLTFIIASISMPVFSQKLDLIDVYKQGETFTGLTNPSEIAIDVFGTNVYVLSSQLNTLTVFSRNNTTGDLTFQQVFKDDSNGVDGLKNAHAITFSPNRKQLYIAGTSDASITVFTRDQVSGHLTFLETNKDATGDVGDLGLPHDITVTSDGAYLYTATNDGIAVFGRDNITGSLTYINLFTRAVDDPSFHPSNIAISLDENYIYASNAGDSSISVFSRDVSTGNLTFLQAFKNGTSGISNMTLPSKLIIPTDETMYAISSRDSSILFFQRDINTGLLSLSNYYKQGQNGIDGLITISSISISNDLNNIYTTSAKDSSLSVFKIDATTGALTYSETYRQGQGGVDGIKGCRFALSGSNGQQLYAAGFNGNTLAQFNRDGASGALSYSKKYTNGVLGNDGLNSPTFIATDNTEKNIYVLSSSKNTLAVYSRNISTGELTFQQLFKDGVNGVDGLKGAKHITISPSRRNLYIAGSTDVAIANFSRNTATGLLTFIEVKKDITGDVGDLGLPNDIKIAGLYLYTSTSDGIVAFNITAGTGKLAYLDIFNRGTSDSFSPTGIEISPDANFLYATNAADSSLNVFSINKIFGTLSFIDNYKNGTTSGITGMIQPTNITMDYEGNNIYVSSTKDSSIFAFSRDQTTGLLSFLEKYKQGVNETSGLFSINSMNLMSDDATLFTTSSKDSSVSIFNRDVTTGKLIYAGTYKQSLNGVDGIKGCVYAIPSEGEDYLYAAGNTSSTIALFKITMIPLAPVNVQTSSTNSDITLTWDANIENNISTYEIFRSRTNDYNTASDLTSITSSLLTYSDNTAISNATYYYWIKATDSDGNSSWFSKSVSASLVENTTAVQQNQGQKISRIYPNPASDKVTIELTQNGTATIELINSAGQLVKSSSFQNSINLLDISDLTQGIYYVKIIGDQYSEIKKLVVR